jgi:hypothetical protein
MPRTDIDLAEYVEAYLEVGPASNADIAADYADACYTPDMTEADVKLFIKQTKQQLPYYTGRKR